MTDLHEIVVVSDLHLGRGKNPRTGRYYRLEAFFFDDDFRHFCQHLIDDARHRQVLFKLVLNGDAFDLLRIDHEPVDSEKWRERTFGPAITPSVATHTMREIVAGHPTFISALAEVLAAGHEVVFLPGNHDIELQWPPVQDVVRQAILNSVEERAGQEFREDSETRLLFENWFHHEPGRIWIEHGCQYDPENAFRYYLRSGIAEEPDSVAGAEVDVPLGTFFQRYLYNRFGNITFIVPNSRSNFRYFRWLIINRPRLLAKLLTSHLPFFLQVLKRIAKSGARADKLREAHQHELEALASQSELGDKLHQIEALKQVRVSSSILARQIVTRVAKIAGFALLGALLVVVLWNLGVHSIGKTEIGVGWKAILFLAFNFLFLVVAFALVVYLLLRPSEGGPDPWLPKCAATIAPLVEVPLVTFGHTHDEEICSLELSEDGAWYFNTGTWIAVFAADTLLPRERVQYTFLHVKGHKGELLHWSPGRHEATPVVLLEDAPAQATEAE